MPDGTNELRARLAETADLSAVASVLAWDQQTMMPPAGAPLRAEQRATVLKLAHERLTSPEVGGLLERLATEAERLPFDSDEASLIRVARRDRDKALRVPAELRAELARAGALGQEAWVAARAASDFSAFLPFLERNLELRLRYAECFEVDHPYDALLDDFEPGMTTAEVDAVFAQLKATLLPLAAAIAERPDTLDDACLHGHFPVERQRALVRRVLDGLGFDPACWRLDDAVHPFASSLGTGDIRITTRYDEHHLAGALFGAMHECGHGLYEHGVSPALERTPLCRGASLGLHESQSRLWENLVGRSRAFCRHLLPALAATFPERFDGVDAETLYRAVNRVAPTLIRVEADEVTYSLHVILRFELERELVEGALAPRDLPAAWNARMHEYLGIEVPDDARGVLQDVHWSAGMIGYFPTYALGNVIAAQLWERAGEAIPDLERRIAEGRLGDLRAWLRETVHRHGRKFTPSETLERAVAGPIDVVPYARYLWAKFGDLYGLPVGSPPLRHPERGLRVGGPPLPADPPEEDR